MPINDFVNYLVALATVVGTAYAGLSYHRSRNLKTQGNLKVLITVNFAIVLAAWAAALYNNNYNKTYNDSPDRFMISWGLTPQRAYFSIINGKLIQQYAKNNKVVLIVRVGYADKDKLTDEEIEKSASYGIANDVEILAHPPSMRLKFLVGLPNSLEFNIALIPNNVSPDRILSLSDVELLGGKLLASAAMNIDGEATQGAPVSAVP